MATGPKARDPKLVGYADIFAFLQNDSGFTKLTTNPARIRHILSGYKTRPTLKMEAKQKLDAHSLRTDKDAAKSKNFRQMGADFYNKNQPGKAIDVYSAAIRYAPHVENADLEDDLFLAYRQRSVVFHRVKHYDKALYDIDQALDICQTLADYCHRIDCLRSLRRYSEALEMITELLDMRDRFGSEEEQQTLQGLQELIPVIQNELETNGDAQVNPPEDDYYLYVDDSVQIAESLDRGRYMMSNNDIPKDTVVIREKPQFTQLFDEFVHHYCNNCHKHIGPKSYPCEWCIVAVFCDKICYLDGMSRYHRYECGIYGAFQTVRYNVQLAYKILLHTGYTSARELIEYMNQINNAGQGFDVEQWILTYNKTVIPIGEKSAQHKRAEFETFLTFLEHYDSQVLYAHIYNTFECLELITLLELNDVFTIEDENAFVELTSALISISRKVQYNAFGGKKLSPTGDPIGISIVVCLVCAMCNHSCVPNINWGITDGIQEFKANRPIRAGTEINISYRPTIKDDFKDRQKFLKDSYKFDCNCELCHNEKENIISLRCLACSGPVFVNNGNCLVCGQPYENYQQLAKTVEDNFILFNQMADNYESGIRPRKSSDTAMEALEVIKTYIYPKNKDYLLTLMESRDTFRGAQW